MATTAPRTWPASLSCWLSSPALPSPPGSRTRSSSICSRRSICLSPWRRRWSAFWATKGSLGSAALVADGHHARSDSLTSLGALLGILGAYLGFPIADPLVGLIISALILLIVVREAGPPVLARLMDAMEPEVIESLERRALAVPGVVRVHTVRARWLGHQIRAELEVDVDGRLTVAAGHQIGEQVRHTLLHDVDRLAEVIVHVDPAEDHQAHQLTAHHFDGSGYGDGHDHDDHGDYDEQPGHHDHDHQHEHERAEQHPHSH